jgi:hypothetical protein
MWNFISAPKMNYVQPSPNDSLPLQANPTPLPKTVTGADLARARDAQSAIDGDRDHSHAFSAIECYPMSRL